MEQAMLITPQGERIALPPHTYALVMEMLRPVKPLPVMDKEELQSLIKETKGMLAGGPSLTQALLKSRREEREREERRARARRRRVSAEGKPSA